MKVLSWLLPISVIVLCIVSIFSGMAGASSRSVVITNNTPYTLTAFYASATYTTASDWSGAPNLLGGGTVAPGQTVTVPISDGSTHCHYDLMGILYGYTQAAYTYAVDSCSSERWNITVSP